MVQKYYGETIRSRAFGLIEAAAKSAIGNSNRLLFRRPIPSGQNDRQQDLIEKPGDGAHPTEVTSFFAQHDFLQELS